MKFDFHKGVKETTIFDYAFIAFVLDLAKHLATKFLGLTEKEFMRFVDEANRSWFRNKKLNDYVLADDKWLEARIEGDVDAALNTTEMLTAFPEDVKIEAPVFTEETQGETALGGELRLTSPWKTDNPISNNNEM